MYSFLLFMEKIQENNVLFSVETAKKQKLTSSLCCFPSHCHTGMPNELASYSGEGIRSQVVAHGPTLGGWQLLRARASVVLRLNIKTCTESLSKCFIVSLR